VTLTELRLRDPKAAYCIERTLPLEGGLADNPHDPGGLTNFGVSLRYALAEVSAHPDTIRFLDIDHDGHVDRKDIAGLTQDEAATVYFEGWWLTGWYAKLVPNLIAWKCFDIAVNTGPNRAALILQKALYVVGRDVARDGAIGTKTIAAVVAENEKNGGVHLLQCMRDGQAYFYRGLVLKEPSLRPFLDGWLARAKA
jgi:lysozyme family protein